MKRPQVVMLFVTIILWMGCQEKKRYHDTVKAKNQVPALDVLKEVLEFQEELNKTFKNPDTSPLPDRHRKDFDGLIFFEPDTNYRVTAKLELTPNAQPFMMPTSTARKSEEVVFGIVHFSLNGKNYELEVYQNQELMLQEQYEDYLFLPFLDSTNGKETYTGGRYIDLRIPERDSIIIDFNKAYNPYCAYNEKYSCPIVPKVNRLNISILAGVRAFKN